MSMNITRRNLIGTIGTAAVAVPGTMLFSSLFGGSVSSAAGLRSHLDGTDAAKSGPEGLLTALVHGRDGSGGLRVRAARTSDYKWGATAHLYLDADANCSETGGAATIIGFSEFAPDRSIRFRPSRPLVTSLVLHPGDPANGDYDAGWVRNEDLSFLVPPDRANPRHLDFLQLVFRDHAGGLTDYEINNLDGSAGDLEKRTFQRIRRREEIGVVADGYAPTVHSPLNIDDIARFLSRILWIEAGDHGLLAVRPEPGMIDPASGMRNYLLDGYNVGSDSRGVNGLGDAQLALRARLSLNSPADGPDYEGKAVLRLLDVTPGFHWAKISLGARDRTNGALVRFGGVGEQSPADVRLSLSGPLDVGLASGAYRVERGLQSVAESFDRRLVPFVVSKFYV